VYASPQLRESVGNDAPFPCRTGSTKSEENTVPSSSNAIADDIGRRFLKRHQAERYRDRFKRGRKRRTHQLEISALERVLAALPPLTTIVDVGSGAGKLAPVLSRHAGHLIQVDISPQMLEVVFEDYPLPSEHGAYLQADARDIPLASGSADLVFCHRLLNHYSAEDRLKALKELARISRAYVVVSCLTPPAFLEMIRRIDRRIRGSSVPHPEPGPWQLLGEARSIGLKQVFCTTIRRFPASATFHTLTKMGG
jgi:SAM-dependent methyltransferase